MCTCAEIRRMIEVSTLINRHHCYIISLIDIKHVTPSFVCTKYKCFFHQRLCSFHATLLGLKSDLWNPDAYFDLKFLFYKEKNILFFLKKKKNCSLDIYPLTMELKVWWKGPEKHINIYPWTIIQLLNRFKFMVKDGRKHKNTRDNGQFQTANTISPTSISL